MAMAKAVPVLIELVDAQEFMIRAGIQMLERASWHLVVTACYHGRIYYPYAENAVLEDCMMRLRGDLESVKTWTR